MEDMLYWVIEYVKVLLSYGCLMFIWPMVVFRKYLAGKSVTFRFSFCVTAQVVIVNTVVLTLGLLHILNDWTMRLVFYGIFLYSVRHLFALTKERKKKIKYLVHGSFGVKNFLLLERRKYLRILEEFLKKIWSFYKKRAFEYTILLIVLAYGLLYFSWGAFQNFCFGTSDLFVHHSWVYQMSQGTVFSSGIYPEAMHCFIYTLNALFGGSIYSSILFIQIIHLAVIFLSMYCLMKELFHWRFSAIFVLLLFMILDVKNMDAVTIMSRLQWALPQEFGFPTIFICGLYLFRYLKNDAVKYLKNKTQKCWNDDLLIFVLALAASIAIHFYVTIMAFFVCVPIAFFMLKQIFTKKRFMPLIAGAVLGVVLAIAPMGVAFASGIPFEGSIYWAISFFESDSTEEEKIENNQTVLPETETTDNIEFETINQNNTFVEGGNNTSEEKLENRIEESTFFEKMWIRIKDIVYKVVGIFQRLLSLVQEKLQVMNRRYIVLFREVRAAWAIRFTVAILSLCMVAGIGLFVQNRWGRKEKRESKYTREYPILSSISIVYMIIFSCYDLGLPVIIDPTRLCTLAAFFVFIVFIIPIDIVYLHLHRFTCKAVFNVAAVAGMISMIALVCKTGNYHGYLFYYLTRYNSAVNVTNSIIENMPKEKYTIVSPTEELYHVIGNGWHEELVDFLKANTREERYEIPTQYVFIFQEKKVLSYVQHHFFTGPDWLAEEEKHAIGIYSRGNDVVCANISEEEAAKEIRYYSKPSDAYKYFDSRIILESKIFEWCERFKELYPNELKTLYEDDYFACYYFEQNVQNLYNLNLEGK